MSTARKIESKAFTPDSLPDPSTRPFSMEIEGEPDLGKTHFCSTFPKALILDSELKADIVLKKAPEKGHVWKKVSSWLDLRGGVDWALGQPDIKTVAIDSGADIREFALEEWRRRTGKTEPVAYIDGVAVPLLWAQVYDLIDTLTGDVQRAGKYFVVTARMEDEYVANVKTGRRVRDSYKKFPWNLSIIVLIQKGILDQKTGKLHYDFYKFGRVVKNNFHGLDIRTGLNYQKPILFDISFEGVCEELLKPWNQGIRVGKETETILKEAETWLKSKNLL